MDLFIINRYKDPGEVSNIEDHERVRLQKLQQKIEERKKASLQKKEKITTLPEPTPTLENGHDNMEKGTVEVIGVGIDNCIENDTQEEHILKVKDTKSAEFQVLGTTDVQEKIKVRRVLPYWLSHSILVSTNLQTLDCKVEDRPWLHDTLKTTLLADGITQLFPVQEVVVPFILSQHKLPFPLWPHDICVSAPTGSGKTLSFVLPIIQVLMNDVGHHIRALVVLPVQELATQVCKVFKKYAGKVGLKVALLSGSTLLRQEQQQIMRHTESAGWVSNVDIIVCTAGRLVEHILNTEGFSLKHLKFLVIDEADRIMDHIQNDWLYHLDRHIKLDSELMAGKVTSSSWSNLKEQKRPPQKLLFSATLSQDPEKLEQWGLFQPKLFSADAAHTLEDDDDNMKKYTLPKEVQEQFVVCDAEKKPLVLYHLLVELNWKRVICFTNASQSAHRLSLLLSHWTQNKVKVAELSAALDRSTREKVLKMFQQAEIDVLISTDALARGIDIPNCDYVISYDPPKNIKTYIHRVGRTGRAGRSGLAVTVLMPNQVNIFKVTMKTEQEQLPQKHIADDVYERLSECYQNAIHATKFLINEENTNKVKKSIALKRGPKQKLKRKLSFNKRSDETKKNKVSVS